MSEISEVLRILAKDGGHLKTMDCAALSLAADELDRFEMTQAALIESQAARIALNERLLSLIGRRNEGVLAPISAPCVATMYQWGSV